MTRSFYGHPKCAGTWFSGYFIALSNRLGLNYKYKQIVLIPENLEELRQRDGIDMYISQNSSYSKAKEIKAQKGIHVIRDPRDITVSAYYSYKNSHPVDGWTQLAELRDKLNNCDMDEGLVHIMEFNKVDIQRMAEWEYTDPDFKNVKLEDFMSNPSGTMISCLEFLGFIEDGNTVPDLKYYSTAFVNRISKKLGWPLKIRQSNLTISQAEYLYENMKFTKMSKGRAPGEERKDSHFRKGVAGDWKNHFKSQHKEKFIDIYGDTLQKLGYEKSNDW